MKRQAPGFEEYWAVEVPFWSSRLTPTDMDRLKTWCKQAFRAGRMTAQELEISNRIRQEEYARLDGTAPRAHGEKEGGGRG